MYEVDETPQFRGSVGNPPPSKGDEKRKRYLALRVEATLGATLRTKREPRSHRKGGVEARSMRYGIEAERSRP